MDRSLTRDNTLARDIVWPLDNIMAIVWRRKSEMHHRGPSSLCGGDAAKVDYQILRRIQRSFQIGRFLVFLETFALKNGAFSFPSLFSSFGETIELIAQIDFASTK